VDTKREIISKKIVEMIRNGIFPPESKLPTERDLADQLNVSRNILRESIIQLEAMGILKVKKRQGIFVVKNEFVGEMENIKNLQFWPYELLPHLTELRLMVSVPAAQLAASRRTENDLMKMEECFERLSSCKISTLQEKIESNRWDSLLHTLTIQAAHNEILNRIYESLSVLIEKSNSMLHLPLVLEEGWFPHTVDQQRRIVEAIKAKDSLRAGNIMREHIVGTVEEMMRIYPRDYSNIQPFYWTLLHSMDQEPS